VLVAKDLDFELKTLAQLNERLFGLSHVIKDVANVSITLGNVQVFLAVHD